MKRASCIWSLLVTLALSPGAFADFGAGLRAYDHHDYTQAYELWLPLAQAGNTDAQNNLGWMFENGLGVETDIERAIYWYDQAAATSPVARKNFDRLSAAKPIRERASRTSPTASGSGFAQGLQAYDRGEFMRAYKLWLPLAESDNADAQNNLGWMFEQGEGVEQSLTLAKNWYRRAAQNNQQFSKNLDRVNNKLAAASPKTPSATVQTTPHSRTHKDLFQSGLDAYDRGDFQFARKLWLPLAKQGHVDAQNNLGWLYENGQGVETNYQEALKWYQLATATDPQWQKNVDRVTPMAQQNTVALVRTIDQSGGSSLSGKKIDTLFQRASGAMERQEYTDAFEVFSLLAEAGHAKSQTNLGYLYANGFGTTVNIEKAQMWYERAAKQGEAYAQNNLGALMASGNAGKPDYIEAYKWFSLAEAKGHREAAQNKLSLEDFMTPKELSEAKAKVQSIKVQQ